MVRKVIRLNKEAQDSLSRGVDLVADAVKLTIGPDGCNATLGHRYQSPEMTNDGMSIAMEIHSDDEVEQLAVEKMQNLAKEIYKEAGDGTTTGITLGQAVKNAGFNALSSKDAFVKNTKSPMVVMNEILEVRDLVIKELDLMAVPIKSNEDVFKVAFVSVENKKYAQMIADMYDILGKDGVITIEDGYDDVEYETTEGFEIEAGFSKDTFANKDDKTFSINNPLFIVTNQRIEFEEQISPIATALHNEGVKELILIADDITKEMDEQFLASKISGGLTIIPVKSPYFGKKEKMQDVAKVLGATFFDRDEMKFLSQATIEDLGTSKKVTITTDKTVIFKESGNVKAYIASLKDELKNTKDRFDKEQLSKRIAKLSGGVGVIKVGGDEETRVYLKKKLQNAVNASKHALQEGIVPGGGLALKAISEKLPKNILTEALLSPYKQIQENAGGTLVIGENIIDPVKTPKTVVKYACSIAGIAITSKIAIADKYEKEKDYKLDD